MPLVVTFLVLAFFNVFNPIPLVSGIDIGDIGGAAEPSPGQQRVLDSVSNSDAGIELSQVGYTQKSIVTHAELLKWLQGESGAANASSASYVVFT